MALNDSFVPEFMPHWIGLNRADVCNQWDIAEMMECGLQDYIIKELRLLTCSLLGHLPWKNPAAMSWEHSHSLMSGPHGGTEVSCQQAAWTGQPCWIHSLQPQTNLQTIPAPWETMTQGHFSHSWIPHPQTLWELINVISILKVIAAKFEGNVFYNEREGMHQTYVIIHKICTER